MRTQIKIVAGALRGRKLVCTVSPTLRPTPQMVREALFSILGNAVPGRPFFDIFAGTGAIGIEAISRGATSASFLERDFRLVGDLEKHLKDFGINAKARIIRTDVYRWVERWLPPAEPVCLFLSPPFADLQDRPEGMLQLVNELRQKVSPGSVVVLQLEESPFLDMIPDRAEWDERRYGRNQLLFWVKEDTELETTSEDPGSGASPD